MDDLTRCGRNPTVRRPRYSRHRTGKRIEIKSRDIRILQLLQRYRYLRSTFIHAFVGGNKIKLVQRLGDLYHEGAHINRPKQQWENFNARYVPAIYELDSNGEDVLRHYGLQDEDVSDLVRRGRTGAIRQFPHAMMICDTLASIELGLRDVPNLRFISWQEIIDRAPEETRNAPNPFAIPVQVFHTFAKTSKAYHATFNIVPDGLFGLEYTLASEKTYRFFALEAERNNRVYCSNLEQSSWLKKTLAYRDIAARKTHRSRLGLPTLMVLVVTPSATRIDTMRRLILDVTDGRGSSLFLFRHVPTLGFSLDAPKPMPELLHEPWQRAGYPAFHINHP